MEARGRAISPRGTPWSCIKKARSPAARDPRFSRGGSDLQIARIRAAQAVRGVSGVGSAWAGCIMGDMARKLHKHDPLRCDLLSRLKKMADGAEAAPVPAALQVKLGSPAPHKAFGAQETVSLQQVHRSVLGAEAIAIGPPVFCE